MENALKKLLTSISRGPVTKEKLDALVKEALTETGGIQGRETRKARWEFLLKDEVFKLAATEGRALKDPDTDYYDQLRVRLDLVLTYTEREACEQTFPLTVLQDLLETQTIRSCSHIFSWIEERSDRLTEGMVPQKGKALVLLRTLNDLLRRLSKMGSNTIFCGRILTFLSSVFPLGERSGVNLRGEYGPTWDGPGVRKPESETKEEAQDDKKDSEPQSTGTEDKMQVDEPETQKQEEQSEDFYTTFWSLQLPFSRPPLFANPETLPAFKAAVDKVLPVIKEATSKERAMMGNRSNDTNGAAKSLKRKREVEPGEETSKVTKEYFFAKFLTSPELLDLEIADTHFRRQFLFQLLILLHHLLSFTKTAKIAWSSSRNRSLQIDFTLDDENAKWVQGTIDSVVRDFLPSTFPNGILFRDTVKTVLEREKNWVQWKNELCAPFDREPWSTVVDGRKVGLEEATKSAREKLREDPPEWEHKLGSAPLTEIWEMGYRDLRDLQRAPDPGTVSTYADKIRLEDRRIEMRRTTLARTAERLAQARARTEVSKASPPTPPAKEPSGAISQESTARPPATNAASPPLHPSLPPKPGSTPTEAPASAPTFTPAPAAPPVQSAPSGAAATVSLAPTPPPIVDDQILKFEENKHRWAWLCLRVAREEYLEHFVKIATGDVLALERHIKEALNPSNPKPEKDGADMQPIARVVEEHVRVGSPATSAVPARESEGDVQMQGTPDVEGDVNMEER